MIEISTEFFYAFGYTKRTVFMVGQLKLCIVSIHGVGATWDIKSGEANVGPIMGGEGGNGRTKDGWIAIRAKWILGALERMYQLFIFCYLC